LCREEEIPLSRLGADLARTARTAREILNELRWREPAQLADATIWYLDRRRPEGHRPIRGAEILDLERRYFVTAGGRLPYYKIERIELQRETLFERRRT
jgi:uncharacterized protein (UPF0248 family)